MKQAEDRTGFGAGYLIGVYLLFLTVYLATLSGHLMTTDSLAVYLTTRSIVEDDSLAIKPIQGTIQGVEDKYYGKYGILQSISSIPLYFAGNLVDRLGNPAVKRYFGGAQLGDFGGTATIFFVSLFNQLLTPALCVLYYLFSRQLGFGRTAALGSTLLYGLGTGVWVYARDYFQHPLESLLILTSIYVLFKNRWSLQPLHALLSGVALGLAVLVRVNVALVAPPILLYLAYLVWKQPGPLDARGSLNSGVAERRTWKPGGAARLLNRRSAIYWLSFLAPLAIAGAVVLWHNYLRFGDILDSGYSLGSDSFRSRVWVGLYGYLFSVGRSIFLYSPPLLLGVAFFRRFFRQWPAEAVLFATISLIYLVTYSAWWDWHGGWSFGPRFMLPTVALLLLPTGYAFGSRMPIIAIALGCLGVFVQLLGVTVNYSYVHYRWEAMHLQPSTAYLFDPTVSAIPTHLVSLLGWRHVDLWLARVFQQFGPGVFLLTASVPAAAFAASLALIRGKHADVLPTGDSAETRVEQGGLGELAHVCAGRLAHSGDAKGIEATDRVAGDVGGCNSHRSFQVAASTPVAWRKD